MSAGKSPLTDRSRGGAQWRTTKSPPSARLGKRGSGQVAAVCYQIRGNSIEFLLVRTRRGRWTFPKGGAEPGLTPAESAALEAFEEAGVHGRIEEVPFTRYSRHKRGSTRESAGSGVVVRAYLCEVLRLAPPQEPNRNRTWFSAEEAKSHLRADRLSDNGAELACVVDGAVARIQRLRRRSTAVADALQKVQFEAFEGSGVYGHMDRASFLRYVRRQRAGGRSTGIEFAINAYLGEVLRLNREPFNENKARLNPGRARRLPDAKYLEAKYTPDSAAKPPRVLERTNTLPGPLQNHRVVDISNGREKSRRWGVSRNKRN